MSVTIAVASGLPRRCSAAAPPPRGPVNPPITKPIPNRIPLRDAPGGAGSKDNLVILAFSGGGTRAAAFSYGVLEFLRRTE
jgi:NTE family protein